MTEQTRGSCNIYRAESGVQNIGKEDKGDVILTGQTVGCKIDRQTGGCNFKQSDRGCNIGRADKEDVTLKGQTRGCNIERSDRGM